MDLRKAFDRIEYETLFAGLRAQGIEDDYISLLATMYCNQTGRVRDGMNVFEILRGVKQGDIISPLLFNAGLEVVIQRWKNRIGQHGICFEGGGILQNIRYADDLMIYATSLESLEFMLEALIEELGKMGLEVNPKKSKILTSMTEGAPNFIEVSGEFVRVMSGDEKHKYLGRMLCGNLLNRSPVEFSHRCQCAWMKFHYNRDVLVDKNISVKSRLKFFQSVISPTILFGFA